MIDEQTKTIVAVLYTQGQEYDMLDMFPWKHNDIPFLLRESAFQFLVVVEGFAQPIIVARNSFAIVPVLGVVTRLVKYVIDGKEDEATEKVSDLFVPERESD